MSPANLSSADRGGAPPTAGYGSCPQLAELKTPLLSSPFNGLSAVEFFVVGVWGLQHPTEEDDDASEISLEMDWQYSGPVDT